MKKTKQKRSYKFRAVIKKKSLYFYTCGGCGKKRSSRIYDRALGKICQVCLKGKAPENQPTLFAELPLQDEAVQETMNSHANREAEKMVECFHLSDDWVLNGKGEQVCSKCHPEILEDEEI